MERSRVEEAERGLHGDRSSLLIAVLVRDMDLDLDLDLDH